MRKLAIFCEGQTEQIFLDKMVSHIAAEKRISIRAERTFGPQSNRILTMLWMRSTTEEDEYFVLLFDCGRDSRVISEIREQANSLHAAQYDKVLGLRDVAPLKKEDAGKLRDGINKQLENLPVRARAHLSVMETEAWFIAEHNHFTQIDPALTGDRIEEKTGYDPRIVDIEDIKSPARDLNDIYSLAGLECDKSRKCVERTIAALNSSFPIEQAAARAPSLAHLLEDLAEFLGANAPPAAPKPSQANDAEINANG